VPYRSSRLFRAQFKLLVDLNLLESAQERMMAETRAGRRLRADRARRDVVELRNEIEEMRRIVAEWKPAALDDRELLARLRPLLAVPVPAAVPARHRVTFSEQLLAWLLALAAGLAWAYTFASVAANGIADRPSLIVAQAFAIVLSPFAIALVGRK
jgi:signal transduction histidine kinase